MMGPHVKRFINSHFWLRYLGLAGYLGIQAANSTLTGNTISGAIHANRSVDAAVDYITSVFQKYKAAVKVERFRGRVAEIGPGDSCGIGLLFLADGCEHVELVDRFFSVRDEHHQQAINCKLVAQFPALAALRRNEAFSEDSFAKLTRHYGKHASAETFFLSHKGYDFIVSCAVLEHTYNPLRALSGMISALKPGGMMLHQIDCRDHGQFSQNFHELKFLELPSVLYQPLKWGGGPNRVMPGSYLRMLQKEPISFKIYVTNLAGVSEAIPDLVSLDEIPECVLNASKNFVCGVRNKLAMPFREMPVEELMITGFLMVARKD